MLKTITTVAAGVLVLVPSLALACACGCGAFDVSTSSMLPTDAGGRVWLEYDNLNQTQNFHNASPSSKYNNADRQIRTDYITAGGQYMVNRSWGVTASVPYLVRDFRTQDEDSGDINKFSNNDVGDIKLQAIYSGLSEDMSTGIKFGLKLPTGDFKAAGFDRDTQIGTGSTDLLLGIYHQGSFAKDLPVGWFANSQWQHAISIQDHYRPGDDFNLASGVYYEGLPESKFGKITPVLQLIGSYRLHDTGMNAMPDDTGYTRLQVAPGVEYSMNAISLYGDIETPIYQNMKGQQLTAPVGFKLIASYSF